MSQEIDLYSRLQNPIDAITQIGRMFAKSGMFGCEREEQGQVLAMVCLVEKKSPVAITRDFDIVEGKLRKKALAALADFRGMGGKHKWINAGDTQTAKEEDWKAELWIKDREGNELTYCYSMADARKEGLIKDKSRWAKRPGNMLRARCISNALGMLCPELYAGEDVTEAPETTAAPLLTPQPTSVVTTAAPVEKPANVIEISPAKANPTHDGAIGTAAKESEVKHATSPVNPGETAAAVQSSAAAPASDEKELAAMGLAPAAKPFGPADVRGNPTTGKLSDETVQALEHVIGEHAIAAVNWLKAKKWIVAELADLSVERARRMLEKPEVFLGHVKGGAK